MADKKTLPVETEERVEVFIPRGQANDDPNFYISVNGYSALLPKGQRSFVPKFVAKEIERSNRAQEALDRKMEAMIDAAK